MQITLVTAQTPNILSKSFSQNDNGELIKTPGGKLYAGVAERKNIIDANELAALLDSLPPQNALCYGVCDHAIADIHPKKDLNRIKTGRHPIIARNRETFSYPDGAGVMMIDYDPPKAQKALTKNELLTRLYDVCQVIKSTPHVYKPSASSCIYNGTEQLHGVTGQRVYLLVQNASDIPRAGKVLFDRLWLAGYGYIFVSASGSMYLRTIIDGAVYQPERLDFAGGAHCNPPLRQEMPATKVVCNDGPVLDTKNVLPDLRPEKRKKLKAIIEEAKVKCTSLAYQKKQVWLQTRLEEFDVKYPKLTGHERLNTKKMLLRAIERKRLHPGFILKTKGDKEVDVAKVLTDKSYHGKYFYDPLEPEYNNGHDTVAWCNLQTNRPYIYSHAHGGCFFYLCRKIAVVKIQPGDNVQMASTALSAIREDGQLYERAGQMVRVHIGKNKQPIVEIVTPEYLQHYLNGLIDFTKFDGRKKDNVAANCPLSFAKTLLALIGHWDLPQLSNVITVPTISSSGRIIEEEGYDFKTCILFKKQFFNEKINKKPKLDDVKIAARHLFRPFNDFPFSSPVSKAGFFSAILTTVARPTLPTAPGFLLTAPTMGTGKTLLACCLAALAGSTPDAIPPAESEDEWRKRLFSAALRGSPVINIDNITGRLKSPSLCAFLTAESVHDRILGKSKMISTHITSMVVCSGNNITLVSDLARRFLTIRLDTGQERPDKRKFSFNPQAYCTENRNTLIAAALTVLCAYTSSGYKPDAIGMASYEDFNKLVRGCVLWCAENKILPDLDDPAKSIDTQIEADPEVGTLTALLEAWWDTCAGDRVTTADLINKANQENKEGTNTLTGKSNKNLHGALDEICGDRGELNPRILGRWLERQKDRIVNDFILTQPGVKSRAKIWRLNNKSELCE